MRRPRQRVVPEPTCGSTPSGSGTGATQPRHRGRRCTRSCSTSRPWTLKSDAIRAHASQVAPLSDLEGDETLLPEELLAHFEDGPEHYLRTSSADCPTSSLDRLHEEEADPWGAESRWYEQRKRDLVLAMLPRPDFDRTLEIGCSTGALAERAVVPLQARAGRRPFQRRARRCTAQVRGA